MINNELHIVIYCDEILDLDIYRFYNRLKYCSFFFNFKCCYNIPY